MEKYQGIITIIGKPNVGKSSLLNAIFDEKVCIVNAKPQTTRNQILSTYIDKNYYLDFIDTPGFHEEKNKLDTFLNEEVKQALKKPDLIYFLCDGTRPLNDDDWKIVKLIQRMQLPLFLVITKMDTASKEIVTKNIEQLEDELNITKIINITVHDKNTVDNLLKQSQEFLTLAEAPDEPEYTIQKDLFLVKEIIREQCLISLRQEIPYGIAVLIEDFKYDEIKNEFFIRASLNVEKESQKKILIGKNGSMIKEISMNSRNELLNIYDAKIYLKLFVKISKKWRDNPTKLKEFGYSH